MNLNFDRNNIRCTLAQPKQYCEKIKYYNNVCKHINLTYLKPFEGYKNEKKRKLKIPYLNSKK